MDYYILCFGRTDFTKSTINSIQKNATNIPRIFLINNGWNRSIVPQAILEHWQSFVNASLAQNLIYKVIDIETPRIGLALDAFAVESSEAALHWISDNDCIIDSPGFDVHAVDLMHTYKELQKLGIDFLRMISIKHCASFTSYIHGFNNYLTKCPDGRIVSPGSEQEHHQLSGVQKAFYQNDSRISTNLTDTTLSICRSGLKISQEKHRISYSIANLNMLHIGYLETIFNNGNDIALLEMLHYMNIRPMMLTEYRQNYEQRKDQYVRNIINSGLTHYLNEYNRIIGK